VVKSGDEITGYFRVEACQGRVQVREVVAMDEAVCETVLHDVYRIGETNGADIVVFFCPHEGTFGRYLRTHGAAEYAPHAQRPTNMQLRVLDLQGCLRKLRIGMSQRLRHSELGNTVGRYGIATEHDNAVLAISDSEVEVLGTTDDAKDIPIPASTMAQLISGFCGADILADSALAAEDRRLIEVLFPRGEPFWYVDDL